MLNPASYNSAITPISLKEIPDSGLYEVDDELAKEIIDYCISRVQNDSTNRTRRIKRYARTDKRISGYQRLSQEDAARQRKEDATGAPQAIAAVLPITDMHIEDTAAFFTEIFAPASGNFYSNQGDVNQVSQIQKLAEMLENDYKLEGYYDSVASVMRSMLKYNVGGFELTWLNGSTDTVGYGREGGNHSEALDLYNFFYDPSVTDLGKLRCEGEWYATAKVKNKLWLLQGAKDGRFINVDKIFGNKDTNNLPGTQAHFYKNPPIAMGLGDSMDIEDAQSTGDGGIDWASYDAGLADDVFESIAGYEILDMKIRIVPTQFDLKDAVDDIILYHVIIVNGQWVIKFEPIQNGIELPVYIDHLRKDEMKQAQKSYADSMHQFQRHISFMANIAVAIERGNTYGLKGIDPMMFDPADFRAGETAGVVVSKIPGRDVRTGYIQMNTATDTAPQYSAMGNLLTIMKELFPNQGLPSQVAGIDRAVNAQVAAVMIGAVRRLHMLVRRMDANLMNPHRVASYRNYVAFHPDASEFQTITEKDVARLLNSGLGQLNREVAAQAIERMLFTLIQNPNSAAQFDLPGLFRIWSQMLNTGQDLGKLIAPQGQAGVQGAVEPVDPNAQTPQVAGGVPTQ